MELVREVEIRARVGAVFERLRARLVELLPGARVEHVGSTAVEGALTKGDLDICVIVEPAELDRAAAVLARTYAAHQAENWTPGFASFAAPTEGGVEIGIQLIGAGGPEEEQFVGWRERLRADADLRARYDRCKAEHRDAPVESYREAKERLILG